MSTLTRDIRIQAFHEVGVKIDDALESAKLETARREGTHIAHANSLAQFQDLLGQIIGTNHDAEITRSCMKAVVDSANSMVVKSELLIYSARGAEEQTKFLVDIVKNIYDTEVVRKQYESVPAIAEVPVIVEAKVPQEIIVEPTQAAPDVINAVVLEPEKEVVVTQAQSFMPIVDVIASQQPQIETAKHPNPIHRTRTIKEQRLAAAAALALATTAVVIEANTEPVSDSIAEKKVRVNSIAKRKIEKLK